MSRFATRLSATALASGALLSAAVLPAAAADHGHAGRPAGRTSQVVIGQVKYDSPGHDNRSNRSLNAEWVTVVNTGRRAVDLGGWTLSGTSHQVYRFPRLRLDGHQSVRVHTGIGRDTYRDVYQDRRDHVWDNRHDTATLRDARGRIVDTKSWWGHRR